MKVHNLSIDSSQRDVTIYPHANNYVITLENPIYQVEEIRLVSAQIPTPQLLICDTNSSFNIDDITITLDTGNYTITQLKNALNAKLDLTSLSDLIVTSDSSNQTLTFTKTPSNGTSNVFKFDTGLNGYSDTGSSFTTPHQVLGFGSNDYTFTDTITSGFVNTGGVKSLVLKLTSGSEEFNQTVYTGTPHFTGHILLNGGTSIVYNGSDDPLVHYFHSGSQKSIRDLKIEFFYMSHGRLIPYDFRNQEHIIKLEVTCSTDKLENLKVDPPEENEEKTNISIPDISDVYEWNKEYTYIVAIVVVGLLLMMLMKGKPKPLSG
jgi:hypothetical protein